MVLILFRIPADEHSGRYSCGHVAIFYAGKLYHKVSDWTPLPKQSGDPVTPGRIGSVFFNPNGTIEVLHDKPPGWGKDTGYGLMTPLLPSAAPKNVSDPLM